MANICKRILLIMAHPSIHTSEINSPMFRLARKIDNITCVDLYAKYPTYYIDVKKEQQLIREHDIIIFQFPFYWYSVPSLLKEWIDIVFSYGFAYGNQGNKLKDKVFFCAITAGGNEESYRNKNDNYTIRELLRPLEMTSKMVGMAYLPPFILYGSNTAFIEGNLTLHLQQWKKLLTALSLDTLNIKRCKKLNTLNEKLSSLIQGDK